ncbi:MAG: hypothetical protein LH660_00585 [Phormidesmis sp. CAN_BIN36]|nr:hypothetical protein [Phormidesmis sp. CAN_BIN36]
MIEERKAREKREQPLESGEDAQSIVVPDPRPSIIVAQIFYEQIVDLVQGDLDRDLRRCYMHNNLHITCQKVILAILQSQPISPNIPWEMLAHQFEVDPVSFRNFCNDTAFPRFKQFCQQNESIISSVSALLTSDMNDPHPQPLSFWATVYTQVHPEPFSNP